MEPGTGLVIKLTTWLLSQFKAIVIEKWSRRRAEAFFQTFVERLTEVDNKGKPLSELEPLLSKLIEDDFKSQILFEAYRQVYLSSSASIGPKIIAVMTARLIAENRMASSEEERLLMAAEMLSDMDLIEFSNYLSKYSPVNLEVELLEETEDSNWRKGSIALGPVNIGEYVGNWCLKMANCGLVVNDLVRKSIDYDVDDDAHVDEPGTLTTYTWKLRFQPEVLDLKGIIDSLRKVSE